MADANRIVADIEALRKISEDCPAGTTRIGFTPEYRLGAEYIKSRMREAGLLVREDSIGNIYGKIAGADESLPVVVSGSHLDTVRCAGAYDGIAGVACALEAARMIKENGVKLRHGYEVMGIIEEEGTRFGRVLLGSQYVTGDLNGKDMNAIKDNDGNSLKSVIDTYRIQGACPALRKPGDIKAFLELHIEQGPVLEAQNIDIGIVDSIVAISWITVIVKGIAGHSGTVPMHLRQDALAGAVRFIDRINIFVAGNFPDSATITIGRISVLPGSSNCIPSECSFTCDIRSGNLTYVKEIINYIEKTAKIMEIECNVSVQVNVDSLKEPVAMDEGLKNTFIEACNDLEYTYFNMNSGAGHDSMIMAGKWRSAMIFIPCVKGITHNPEEEAQKKAMEKGTNLLYETILRVDKQYKEWD